ncbi:hypothetical protein PAMP_016988 [Pampus punctatissimus]
MFGNVPGYEGTVSGGGEPADFYTQTAPRPWEVQAKAPNYFTKHKEVIRVPFTSSIKLYPLIGFPEPAISEASERMVKDHQHKYSQTSRILQQRQTVELIPITKVNYKWKGDSYDYFVYGNEHKVSANNYPATCCCVVM